MDEKKYKSLIAATAEKILHILPEGDYSHSKIHQSIQYLIENLHKHTKATTPRIQKSTKANATLPTNPAIKSLEARLEELTEQCPSSSAVTKTRGELKKAQNEANNDLFQKKVQDMSEKPNTSDLFQVVCDEYLANQAVASAK